MNFACERCQHRYVVPDEKVQGRTVRIRCRHCDHLTAVTGPPGATAAPAQAPLPASPAAPTPARGDWYVMVKGAQAGPYDLPGLAHLARAGDAAAKSFVWRKGMAEWARAADVPELAALFAPPAPEPQTAPAPGAAPPRSSALSLGELFSDDEPASRDGEDEPLAPAPAPPGASPGQAKPRESEPDPFAALGDIDPAKLGPPGESTMFFINQAGVNKRNPPWKIAAFIGGGVGLVAGVLFLLSSLDVVPLTVRGVDADGNEVEQSVFSAGGVSGLGDLLLGKKQTPEQQAAAARKKRAGSGKAGAAGVGPASAKDPKPEGVHQPTAEELAALYGDTSRSDKGPRIRRAEQVNAPSTAQGGLSDEQVHRVVTQSQTAFQACIEQALRKNPNLKVPRFYIRATVATSGRVTAASIDRREVDGTSLGECLKNRARRMTFAAFAGEELVVEIPLIVGVAM